MEEVEEVEVGGEVMVEVEGEEVMFAVEEEEQEENTLRTIEEEPQIWNTSVQTFQDFDYYEPKKQKKGFWEDDYIHYIDTIHPASLFEALFPRKEEKKPEPKSKSTSKSKSDGVDIKTKPNLLIKETVDHNKEKKLNREIVENYVDTMIEREEDVPAYRNMPYEKTVKLEARRRPKVDNEEEKKVYQCPFCNRSTRSPEKITKHLEQIHKREMIQQAMKEKFPVKKDSRGGNGGAGAGGEGDCGGGGGAGDGIGGGGAVEELEVGEEGMVEVEGVRSALV